MFLSLAAALGTGSWPAARADSAEGTLQVMVSNIRNSRGHSAWPSARGRPSCARIARSTAAHRPSWDRSRSRSRVCCPAPTQQAFHDESDSGQIKLSLLGIPKEGVGFSKDASIRFSEPSFSDAAFQLPTAGGQVSLRLGHFD